LARVNNSFLPARPPPIMARVVNFSILSIY
jgi:hypothetical protein